MPRPTTKSALLAQSRANHEALNALIDALSTADRARAFKPGTPNRNVRDVLGHLHHWHTLMLDWYAVGSSHYEWALKLIKKGLGR